jgi:alkaline phosphatase
VAKGGKRADGRDLLAELAARGYRVAADSAQFNALAAQPRQPAIGLFAPNHLAYDAERDAARQPGLADMTRKAIGILSKNPNGFFLMVEGGLIDHALHATRAKRALQETVSYDAALKAAIDDMQAIDPGLKNTLIVATADHDHTLLLNGYSPRTGKTTAANPGVLGLVRHRYTGKPMLDKDGAPYTIIGFGTGENRVAGSRAQQPALTDEIVSGDDYHQEAAIRVRPGAATHGGADVYLGAIGAGAETFRGTIDNTRVFSLIKAAAGGEAGRAEGAHNDKIPDQNTALRAAAGGALRNQPAGAGRAAGEKHHLLPWRRHGADHHHGGAHLQVRRRRLAELRTARPRGPHQDLFGRRPDHRQRAVDGRVHDRH